MADMVVFLPETRAYRIPGSWAPLTLMMGIFVCKYILGALTALASPVLGQAWFAPCIGLTLGLLGGGLAARAIAFIRIPREGLSPNPGRIAEDAPMYNNREIP